MEMFNMQFVVMVIDMALLNYFARNMLACLFKFAFFALLPISAVANNSISI